MLRDMKNKVGIVHILEAKSQSAGAVKSSIIDTVGFRGVNVLVNYGVFTPNTATDPVASKLQESDTTADGDFTDVAAADLVGSLAGVKVDASDDQRSELIGYKGVKRYVRLHVTVPANSTSLVLSANAILGMGDNPVSAPAPIAAT